MIHQPFDILKDKAIRMFFPQNALHLKEKRSACVQKAAPFSCGGKRLAGETREKKVKIWNLRSVCLRNVTVDFLIWVVLKKDIDRRGLYLGRKNTFAPKAHVFAGGLKALAYAADSREEVDEFQIVSFHMKSIA